MPTHEIDGHDVDAIRRALVPDEPRLEVVVAQTRKGCGVSFMEDRMEWHYLPLTEPLYLQAVRGNRAAMRNVFCQSLVEAAHRPEFVFLTGDLGYKALEPLRDALGERFINAGVAEQNMVSVGAGLARAGLRPWVYSIAPFVYARPFEQIRNDVCLHRLPVVLVGNGGGYGYGVMGATHHALEDYGALLCLPHMRAYVPAFDGDLPRMVERLFSTLAPGLSAAGPLRGARGCRGAPLRALAAADGRGRLGGPGRRPPGRRDLGCRSGTSSRHDGPPSGCSANSPSTRFPRRSWPTWRRSRRLLVVEEHVAHGGVGQMIAGALLCRRHPPSTGSPPGRPRATSPAGTARRSSTAASAASTRHRSSSS